MARRRSPIAVSSDPSPRRNRGDHTTTARGLAVLNSPSLNKGTAFSEEEREQLGVVGLLPPEISTLEHQVENAYLQYDRLTDPLSKNIYLTALHDRNEVLFFRLFSEHLREMIPIVNDMTVGQAVEHYHHECRRPRGVYLSIDHPDSIEVALSNLAAGPGEIDLILATDAEQILGVGDCGVGGIEVSIGKLAIYTAAGGVDPQRAIPVMLDVGTNRESLLNSPAYIGNRHPRVRGKRYDDFIDAYVSAACKLFPGALLQWEDLEPENGRRILDRYRDRICTFNDDIQGTGTITLAAALSAVRAGGIAFRNQRVVIFGAGTSGIGIADQLRNAMIRDGLSSAQATRRVWCVDRQGLITDDPKITRGTHQREYAHPVTETHGWKRDEHGAGVSLAEVVHQVRPTMLIGASTIAGAFSEAIVREMAAHTDRPVIFVLSTPQARAEAKPSDLLAWTEGRALIGAGSPFPAATYKGQTYVIAQVNNAMVYPGLALGTIVARASRVSDGMLSAAANAVSSLVTVRQVGASLLPHVDDLRCVSLTVAAAVAEAADAEGLAGAELDDISQQVADAMWQPEYRAVIAC